MSRKRTQEEYIHELSMANPNIEVLGIYIDSNTKILHKCKIDNYEWMARPNDLLHNRGCPVCGLLSRKTKRRKSHDQYVREVYELNPNIIVIGTYTDAKIKILHKCKIDGYEWYATPNNILRGKRCPVCTHQKIGNPPEYKNSIWSSEYKEYFSKYMTEEQMKMYMPHTAYKVDVRCPDCKNNKMISPDILLKFGLGCKCSDGQSYPNKFMYEFFNQLKINYITEYSPCWANGKRYDIYIPSFNCIIENHGRQHYEKSFEWVGGRTLEEELNNDKEKKALAVKHGICNYIELDCRYSSQDWIKNSIIHSEIFSILNISIDSINWSECDKFATSNRIKLMANMWNNGASVKDISEIFKTHASTIRTILRKAAKLEWCNYNSEERKRRTREKRCNKNVSSV